MTKLPRLFLFRAGQVQWLIGDLQLQMIVGQLCNGYGIESASRVNLLSQRNLRETWAID